MSRRYWVGVGASALTAAALIAAWFALLEYWSYQRQHAYQSARAAQHNEYSTKDIVRKCLDEGDPTFSKGIFCLSEAINSAGEAQYTKYDLQAQQDMAEFAYGLLWISLFGLIVTAFGVALVIGTLRAALGANTIAKQTGEAQIRAYVSVRPDFISSFDSGRYVWARYEIKNTGDSPAFKVRHNGRIDLFPPTLQPGFTMPPINVPETSGASIFPGAHLIGRIAASRTFTPRERVLIRQGKLVICIWAEVHYEDFTRTKPRHTRVCAVVDYDKPMLRKLTTNYLNADLEVRFAYPDQHNDAD